jgi:hypothetical protein
VLSFEKLSNQVLKRKNKVQATKAAFMAAFVLHGAVNNKANPINDLAFSYGLSVKYFL